MRWRYACTLCEDPAATRDDIREARTLLADTERTARRVLGGAHPTARRMGRELEEIRAWLRDSRRRKLICARLFALVVTVLAVVLAIRYGESTS